MILDISCEKLQKYKTCLCTILPSITTKPNIYKIAWIPGVTITENLVCPSCPSACLSSRFEHFKTVFVGRDIQLWFDVIPLISIHKKIVVIWKNSLHTYFFKISIQQYEFFQGKSILRGHFTWADFLSIQAIQSHIYAAHERHLNNFGS